MLPSFQKGVILRTGFYVKDDEMYLNTLFGNGLNSKILSLKEPLANITWHSGNCSDCQMAFKHFKSANDVQLTEYNLKF